MICVSIGRGRHKMMIAEHRHLAEQGVKLVELRLDYISRSVNLKRLLTDRPCPTIATCRRESDGGMWQGSQDARLMLLRSAIVEGVEYVDLEEDVAGSVPRYGKTKRLVSYHNFRETPQDLAEIHARLAALDPDIVKIATMAHSPHDNLRMLQLMQQSSIPTIGICMGDIGTPSRILAGKFGAPFTFATFHHERALAPGQLSYAQMVEVYNYDHIGPDTEVFAVIADPIAHSLSPVVHNAALQHLGLNKVYVPFRVPREDLDEFLADCRDLGIKALSVTIPHKEAVIRHLTKVDGAVRGIGAANTVIFENEEAIGYNTDFRAALESLEAAAGEDVGDKQITHKTALVLGAGGVSKAIAFGLKRRGANVLIASRNLERAQDLAKRLDCRVVEWANRHGVTADVLVNGTPVGMHPNVDETPFERRHLRPSTIVFDTVYNPEQTLLLKEARQQGCTVVSGLEMFVRQAALQFKLFTGQEAPLEVMREALRRAIGPARY
jgi:3-dehydroquinate dehydratase/shikimate dehydrogenase